jgi:hypothetical protein
MMALQPRRQPSSYSPPWEPQILLTEINLLEVNATKLLNWLLLCESVNKCCEEDGGITRMLTKGNCLDVHTIRHYVLETFNTVADAWQPNHILLKFMGLVIFLIISVTRRVRIDCKPLPYWQPSRKVATAHNSKHPDLAQRNKVLLSGFNDRKYKYQKFYNLHIRMLHFTRYKYPHIKYRITFTRKLRAD